MENLERIKNDLEPLRFKYVVNSNNKITIEFFVCVQYRKLMKTLREHGVACHYELFPNDDRTIITLLTYKNLSE